MELLMRYIVFGVIVTSVVAGSIRNIRSIENAENSTKCDCDWRYLRHYEARGCHPVEENACGCPEKFTCPLDKQAEKKYKICTYKGKEYQVGSKIDILDSCQICKCLGRRSPRVYCIPVECPPLENGPPPQENCHLLYKKNSCCPTGYQCLSEESEEINDEKFMCEHDGMFYPEGAKIYPEDDPCTICECNRDWNGLNSSSCRQHECVLEKNKEQLDAGCIPVYHENKCCPVEFYCPMDHNLNYAGEEDFSPEPLSIDDSKDLGSQCQFSGQKYEVGEELAMNHPTNCIKCSCVVPPDFTCVHQSCPSPPNTENCYPTYVPDECCPKYDCMLEDDIADEEKESLEKRELEDASTVSDENPCSGIQCDEGMKCMLYLVSCGNATCPPVPTCLRVNDECTVPVCDPNCAVTEQDNNSCVLCVCGDDINKHGIVSIKDIEKNRSFDPNTLLSASKKFGKAHLDNVLNRRKRHSDFRSTSTVSSSKCEIPECRGQNCRMVRGSDNCPICNCDANCPVINCQPGCNVIAEVEGSQCPRCVCEEESVGCPTPICADETCRIESPPGGCPTCICGNKVPGQVQQDQQREVNEEVRTEWQTFEDSDSNEDTEAIQIRPGKTNRNQNNGNELNTNSGHRQP